MPKIVIRFNNETKKILDDFFDYVSSENKIDEYDEFVCEYTNFIKEELKTLRDINQTDIVKQYTKH